MSPRSVSISPTQAISERVKWSCGIARRVRCELAVLVEILELQSFDLQHTHSAQR